MKNHLIISLLLIYISINGCFTIQFKPHENSGTEVIFCEIEKDHIPFFNKPKIIGNNGLKIDYMDIQNQKGIFLGMGGSFYSYPVFQLGNGKKILIDNSIYHRTSNNKTSVTYVVYVEKYEELKQMIGRTIWLNRDSSGDKNSRSGKPHVYTDENSKFNKFDRVMVTSVETFYNGLSGLWLGIEGENKNKGYLMYLLNPIISTYYNENPIKKEWGEEIINKIKKGEIRFGMTPEQVRLSWGIPWDSYHTSSIYGSNEQWVYKRDYDKYYLYFDDGKLISIDH